MTSASTGIVRNVIPAPSGLLIVEPAVVMEVRPLLSLVVPVLNEAENIADFLTAVRRVLDRELPGSYELIVVDDDSTDGTCETAAALLEGFPELRVVRRRGESGLAAAVIRGWQASHG